MKADHRHELKTNELADWLAHFPEWAKENRTNLIAVGVIIVLGILLYYVRFYRAGVSMHKHERLTGLVMQLPAEKQGIAQAVSQGTDQSIALLPLAEDLEKFAKDAGDDNMSALAWIKRGETLRSELHYRLADLPREEVAKRITQAQASYKEALDRASDNPALAAMAKLGLGLCEEELGNFQAAADLYKEITSETQYDGTVAQTSAAYRLETMDDYKSLVVFKPAPAPKPTDTQNASTPAIQFGPGATNGPIKIQVPETVTPVQTPTSAKPEGTDTPATEEIPSTPAPVKVPEANQPAGS